MSQIILNEGLNSLNRIKLMMEYDLSKTYSENSMTISEQVMAPGMDNYLAKNPIKPLKGMSFDEFMEDFREKLYSPGGIAVESFLTSFGITAPLVVGSYAVMLVYDIYKAITTGEFGWFDLIFDIMGVLTSGTMSGLFSQIAKSAKGVKGVEATLAFLKNSKLWVKISPYLKKLSTWMGQISTWIKDAIIWITKKTGNTTIGKQLSKINSVIKTVLDTIQNTVTKLVSKVANPKVATNTGKSVRTGAHAAGLVATATPVVRGTNKYVVQPIKKAWNDWRDVGRHKEFMDNNPLFDSGDAFDLEVKK